MLNNLHGRAYGMRPGAFDPSALREGTRHEMEHTKNPEIAQRIAMDHLAEDPNYYKKLQLIHINTLSGVPVSPQSGALMTVIGSVLALGLVYTISRPACATAYVAAGIAGGAFGFWYAGTMHQGVGEAK